MSPGACVVLGVVSRRRDGAIRPYYLVQQHRFMDGNRRTHGRGNSKDSRPLGTVRWVVTFGFPDERVEATVWPKFGRGIWDRPGGWPGFAAIVCARCSGRLPAAV